MLLLNVILKNITHCSVILQFVILQIDNPLNVILLSVILMSIILRAVVHQNVILLNVKS